MKTMSIDEFKAACVAQAPTNEKLVFRCPMCGTLQSGQDLINAGAGKTFEEIERYLGFSCIGRFTGAASPRAHQDGKPCNWTLGGLFKMHTLEVVTGDGKHHPHFDLATRSEAEAHWARTERDQPGAKDA